MTESELAGVFGIEDAELEALGNRPNAMLDGQIAVKAALMYRAVSADDVTGTISAHAKGFGFVVLDDMPDLFLHEKQMRRVFTGDTVNAIGTSSDNRGRTEDAFRSNRASAKPVCWHTR